MINVVGFGLPFLTTGPEPPPRQDLLFFTARLRVDVPADFF